MRLPLLQQHLNFPAQALAVASFLGAEVHSVEVGDQIEGNLIATQVRMHDERALELLLVKVSAGEALEA